MLGRSYNYLKQSAIIVGNELGDIASFHQKSITTRRLRIVAGLTLGIVLVLTLILRYCSSLPGYSLLGFDPALTPPYPPSVSIMGVSWDFSHIIQTALGSDEWPTTWGADDNVYTGWGDGGGFGGGNMDGRVSLGFARIEGTPPNITGKNVWGSYPTHAEHAATFCGKPDSMISVGGVLYAWIDSFYNNYPAVNYVQCNPNPNPPENRLAWSNDLSATWQASRWKFTQTTGTLSFESFLNFGKDNAGARDSYIYMYGSRKNDENHFFLARVLPANLKNDPTVPGQSSYQYFTGLNAAGKPTWSPDSSRAQPVLSDPNGAASALEVTYNPGIKRYLAVYPHGPMKAVGKKTQMGQLALMDAPEPWGPWTTAAYYDNWGGYGSNGTEPYYISPKWISPDGTIFWMTWSGGEDLGIFAGDAFHLVKATLTLKAAR